MVVPLEAAVVRRIVKYLDSIGAWHVKTTGVAKVGCPDLLVCYKGLFYAFEVKRPELGRVSPRQQYELGKIQRAQGHALVVSSVDQVREVLC